MKTLSYHLIWTTGYACRVAVDGHSMDILPYRVLLVFPGHEFLWVDAPPQREELSISPALIARFFALYREEHRLLLNNNGPLVYLDLEPEELLPLTMVVQVLRKLPPSVYGRFVDHLSLSLLLHLSDCFRRRGRSKVSTPEPAELDCLRVLIEEHFTGERSCRFYAGQLQISARVLNSLAKRFSGKLVSELIKDRLFTEAESLLSSSAFSIKSIAYDLGFADPAHFNRFFHKKAGMSPLRYRLIFHNRTSD